MITIEFFYVLTCCCCCCTGGTPVGGICGMVKSCCVGVSPGIPAAGIGCWGPRLKDARRAGSGAGMPASTAGSGVGIPAKTAGLRTGIAIGAAGEAAEGIMKGAAGVKPS